MDNNVNTTPWTKWFWGLIIALFLVIGFGIADARSQDVCYTPEMTQNDLTSQGGIFVDVIEGDELTAVLDDLKKENPTGEFPWTMIQFYLDPNLLDMYFVALFSERNGQDCYQQGTYIPQLEVITRLEEAGVKINDISTSE